MKFTLWGLMVNPGMTPAPVSSVHRQQMVDRYLHPVPPPAMKKRACLFGWVAVAVAAVAITLLVLGHIVLFLAGSAVAIVAFGAGIDVTRTYRSEYEKSWPKPSSPTP